MRKYEREDFEAVGLGPPAYYCPGCNASPEDYNMPSRTCPCATHARGSGALRPDELESYLADTA